MYNKQQKGPKNMKVMFITVVGRGIYVKKEVIESLDISKLSKNEKAFLELVKQGKIGSLEGGYFGSCSDKLSEKKELTRRDQQSVCKGTVLVLKNLKEAKPLSKKQIAKLLNPKIPKKYKK